MPTSKQLLGSYSVPNVNLVYVCLVGNITPGNPGNKSTVGCESAHSRQSLHIIDNDNEEVGTSKDNDTAIEVQRSVAFHELIESSGKFGNIEYFPEKIEEIASETIPLPPHKDDDGEDENKCGNPKILSLTKTKWLSESRDGSPDARESLMQSTSESSVGEDLPEHHSTHKALSTVLALDKEHNLFGLSNTYIQLANPKTWKKMPKDSDSKAVFHQTAIVQACFKTCCRRRSKTDLPSSLKCGGCKSKCSCARCRSCTSCTSLCRSSCSTCAIPCNTPCSAPCGSSCVVPCPLFWSKPCPPKPCPSKPCPTCSGCCTPVCNKECPRFGFQVSVIKKPKYDPVYAEIEPKSSCVLAKPFLARSCNHHPCCMPPSSCFPYLMPCFWPSRSGAPCSEPSQCFHNPPCPKGRTPRGKVHPLEVCPHGKLCVGKDKGAKCENYSCIGRNNEALAKALTDYNHETGKHK
ncbi:uncharacterized protein LOC133525916 isoform X1 [Cydia pomonella]|uniref:uncharacterized protein LOC133525916 isoform X1 n=1 Tax=Cydia pomonella TaxID=82600 RepID=UPI002ADD538B|nr:uncharacterized protein LOC133525916 isoform X1 [Cydia pomonella]